MMLELGMTPAFMDQLLTLPTAQIKQINHKSWTLCANPHPDGHQRKILKHHRGRLYRLRCGKYRVIYHFNDTFVRLVWVDARSDVYGEIDDLVPDDLPTIDPLDTVDFDIEAVAQPDPAIEQPWLVAASVAPAQDRDEQPTAKPDDPLPHPVTEQLLRAMKVPVDAWPKLVGIITLNGLTNADVESSLIDRLFNVIAEPNIDQLLAAPVLELTHTDDLDRIADGDMVALLLRLDPDQERLVRIAVSAGGPVMIKGGPGSGKTTIAVRRVATVLAALREAGTAGPRLLFTTYTNTLVSTTRQLLQRVLGDDAHLVEVVTTDKLVHDIVIKADGPRPILGDRELLPIIHRARQQTGHAAGDSGVIGRLSDGYVRDEIMQVIVAREIPDLVAYQGIERTGRRVPLRREQRSTVWTVAEGVFRQLGRDGKLSWQMLRRRAVTLVREHHAAAPALYDAIFVDEVQDLDPTTIRLLTELCPSRSRLFLTADANQSIYGGTFSWSTVHADLRFQGRTGNLTRSHRTTYEIVRAASRYLATDPSSPLDDVAALAGDPASTASGESSGPDDDRLADQFPKRGPLPIVADVAPADAVEQLAAFIREATARERVGLAGTAVLAPTTQYGEQLAAGLRRLGLRADCAKGNDLDLSAPAVKITTLMSAKGLEFPVVAIAGLHLPWGTAVANLTDAEAVEEWQRRRRTLYVGMTRAMRSLLVLRPPEGSHLAAGFVPGLWDEARV